LSRTDALTRLGNRRKFDADLATEIERSTRYGRPLSLIIADVDHFKRFNDVHGHQRGDEALAMVGTVLADEARATDTPYRYGGEEFVVIVREGDEESGHAMAERLRDRLEQRLGARLPGSALTASFGVAEFAPGQGPAALIARADAALYRAKDEGRNRVVRASEMRPSSISPLRPVPAAS